MRKNVNRDIVFISGAENHATHMIPRYLDDENKIILEIYKETEV